MRRHTIPPSKPMAAKAKRLFTVRYKTRLTKITTTDSKPKTLINTLTVTLSTFWILEISALKTKRKI
jgi:hypothetical protein